MRRPVWTECDGGWSCGPYLIERLTHDHWVLSLGRGLETKILTTASSASELEAFSMIHARVRGPRPLLLILGYLTSIAGVVVGSVLGSTTTVVVSSLLTVAVVAQFSGYVTGRRVVRTNMPASVR